MEETRLRFFGLVRLINIGAGLALLLGIKGPSGGAATTALIYFIAFPFLLLPLLPGRQMTVLCHTLARAGCGHFYMALGGLSVRTLDSN
jgi:hypothetical protein